jgi:3-oxoacyl-[acyl-carrier protein] reductase
VGTATSEQGARGILDELSKNAIRGTGMVLNVTSTDSIAAFFKSMQDDIGNPTVLVNNAGITRDNLLLRMKDEEWDAVIHTNLTSVFHMSKACLRGMMKARHGRIITITSVVGATGNPGQANYAATKAGVIGFTKSLAREVGSRGITVNAVAPGFIDTDMTRALSAEQREKLIEQIPLARLGDARDVACAVAFCIARGRLHHGRDDPCKWRYAHELNFQPLRRLCGIRFRPSGGRRKYCLICTKCVLK